MINELIKDIIETIQWIRKKYPNEQNTLDKWLALIGEEYGELCRAVNDEELDNTVNEGVQTCAAILLMLEQYLQGKELKRVTYRSFILNDK